MSNSTIQIEQHNRVVLIRLNRPKVLNALNDELMDELGQALLRFDQDNGVHAMVITGNEKAFAAGADITNMAPYSFAQAYQSNLIGRNWETLRQVRKPVIAAVCGFALGGGCELAMMCDTIVCADNAKFGQPEIKLGIIPGAGGTQRLPHAVGKAKAMDLCLTARMMDAQEAERAGLVARVVSTTECVPTAMAMAQDMAQHPIQVLMMAKECINRAFESPLNEGLLFERRGFHSLFGTHDQAEGMAAFLEKRTAQFKNS
jgi:enoyl-CoA hydratase